MINLILPLFYAGLIIVLVWVVMNPRMLLFGFICFSLLALMIPPPTRRWAYGWLKEFTEREKFRLNMKEVSRRE